MIKSNFPVNRLEPKFPKQTLVRISTHISVQMLMSVLPAMSVL